MSDSKKLIIESLAFDVTNPSKFNNFTPEVARKSNEKMFMGIFITLMIATVIILYIEMKKEEQKI